MSFIKTSNCPFCGSNGFTWIGDNGSCEYCGGTMVAPKEEKPVVNVNATIKCDELTTIRFNEMYRKIRQYKGTDSDKIDEMLDELEAIDPSRPENNWLSVLSRWCDNCSGSGALEEWRTYLYKADKENYTYKKFVEESVADLKKSVEAQERLNQKYMRETGADIWSEFDLDISSDTDNILEEIYSTEKTTDEIYAATALQIVSNKSEKKAIPFKFLTGISLIAGVISFVVFVLTFYMHDCYVIREKAITAVFIAGAAFCVFLFVTNCFLKCVNNNNENLAFAWHSYIDWLVEKFNFKSEEEIKNFLATDNIHRHMFYCDNNMFII